MVIRQKGKSQNGCFKKTKRAKFSEKVTFLTLPSASFGVFSCISGWEMFVFQRIWRAVLSWNTRFEVHPFALLPTKSNFKERFRFSTNAEHYSKFYCLLNASSTTLVICFVNTLCYTQMKVNYLKIFLFKFEVVTPKGCVVTLISFDF